MTAIETAKYQILLSVLRDDAVRASTAWARYRASREAVRVRHELEAKGGLSS